MDPVIQEQVEKSLVNVLHESGKINGTGFRVGDYILTAAHCVPRTPGLLSGIRDRDYVKVDLAVREEPAVKSQALVAFVDPCADLAILGNDGPGGIAGARSDEFLEGYDRLLKSLNSLSLDLTIRPYHERFMAHVRTIEGEWTSGPGFTELCTNESIRVKFDKATTRGTSGSPVSGDSGLVMGVLSGAESASEGDARDATIVSLVSSLPMWLFLREADAATRQLALGLRG